MSNRFPCAAHGVYATFLRLTEAGTNLAPISTVNVNVTVNATLKDLDAQSKGLTVSQCECECECECIITMRVYSVSVRKLTRQHISQHVSAVSFHYPPFHSGWTLTLAHHSRALECLSEWLDVFIIFVPIAGKEKLQKYFKYSNNWIYVNMNQ